MSESHFAPMAVPATEQTSWSATSLPPNAIAAGGLAVEVIGNLNPLIFNPDWFAQHSLITVGEREEALSPASGALFTPGLCRWATGLIDVEVTQQALMVSTASEANEQRLLRMAASVFELLHHTPVALVEIERFVHCLIVGEATQADRDPSLAAERIGGEASEGYDSTVPTTPEVAAAMSRFAVRDIWDVVLPSANVENISVAHVGEGRELKISVQPSAVVSDGLYCSVAEAYALFAEGGGERELLVGATGLDVVKALQERGDDFTRRSRDTIAHLVNSVRP